VHPRKSITAILHKPRSMGRLARISPSQFASCKVEVGQKKCMDNDRKHTLAINPRPISRMQAYIACSFDK
jgi:hypothetical protein